MRAVNRVVVENREGSAALVVETLEEENDVCKSVVDCENYLHRSISICITQLGREGKYHSW